MFFGGVRRSAFVRNVSIGGVYLALPEPPPSESRVVMTFSLAGDRTHIACEGRVRWVNEASRFDGCGIAKPDLPPGCGVEFLGLDGLNRQWIEALVRLMALRRGSR